MRTEKDLLLDEIDSLLSELIFMGEEDIALEMRSLLNLIDRERLSDLESEKTIRQSAPWDESQGSTQK